MSKPRILCIHGPNLDRLGIREPELYGDVTLAEIDRRNAKLASELGAELESFQSNHEGQIIDRIHEAADAAVSGYLVNPGGLGHTSVALRDAFLANAQPLVEVHCSNTAAREEFRRESVLSDIAVGFIVGFGAESYRLGLRALVQHLSEGKGS